LGAGFGATDPVNALNGENTNNFSYLS